MADQAGTRGDDQLDDARDRTQAIGEGDTKGALTRADAIINNGLSPDSLVAEFNRQWSETRAVYEGTI